jgi:hypothetical protein
MDVGAFGLAEDEAAEAAEFVAVVIAETAEDGAGPRLNFGAHGVQQLDTFGGDVGDGLALVFVAARAADELARLQAIDEPSDIGGAVQHAAGDLASRMALGVNAAEDAQHVILRPRNFVLGAKVIHKFVQCGGSDQNAEQRLLRGAGELVLLQAPAQRFRHRFFIRPERGACHAV